jgi:Zn-dependent oligopeptidase
MAMLAGFKNYAQLAMTGTMIPSPEVVHDLLTGLSNVVDQLPPDEQEDKELQQRLQGYFPLKKPWNAFFR